MATNIFLGYPPENIKQFIIENYGPKDMTKVPLHFEAEEPNATMSFSIGNGTYETSPTGEDGSWTQYKSNTPITLSNVGDKVYFRAGSDEGNRRCNDLESETHSYFTINNGNIAASGNIQSLLDRKMERMDVPFKCYMNMFSGCTSLTQAPTLPATTLASMCYLDMFSGCTSLTQSPELPATTLDDYCYIDVFAGCTSIPEPKYKMPNLTFNEVANEIQSQWIFGEEYEGDPIQVQCSDKVLVATFENWEWTVTEK